MSDEQNDELQAKGAALVDGDARDVIAAIPGIDDPAHLQAALDAETAGKNRVKVVGALSAAINPPLPPVEAPEGHIVLAAPKNASSACWNGVEYPVADGQVVVPDAAQFDLANHGFSVKGD